MPPKNRPDSSVIANSMARANVCPKRRLAIVADSGPMRCDEAIYRSLLKKSRIIVGILIIGLLSFLNLQGQDCTPQIVEDSIVVHVFMLEDCLITQNYTLALRQLHEKYTPYHIDFVGWFPNDFSTEAKIDSFQELYQIPFLLLKDENQTQTKQFGATVTPEVVIYNYTQKEILYKGRIDNKYYRVGRQRGVTTTFELAEALEAIVCDREILVKETESVGCFINF